MEKLMFVLLFVLEQAFMNVCVNHAKFKTCTQSGFCKRVLLDTEPSHDRFTFDEASLVCQNGMISAYLYDQILSTHLTVMVTALKNNRVRIQMDEKNPRFPRFNVYRDALQHWKTDLITDNSAIVIQRNRTSCILKLSSGNIVTANFEPFLITIYDGLSNKIFSFNEAKQVFLEPHIFPKIKSRSSSNHHEIPYLDNETTVEHNNNNVENIDSDDDDGHTYNQKQHQQHDETSYHNNSDNIINKQQVMYEEDESQEIPEEFFDGVTDVLKHGYQAVSMDATFHNFEHIYGIPEHAHNFVLKTNSPNDPYRLFNLDVFEFILDSTMALYGSVPFLHAQNAKQAIGFLFMNAAETWVSLSKSSSLGIIQTLLNLASKGTKTIHSITSRWVAESGVIDALVLLGPSPHHVSLQLSQSTGFQQLPPLFSLAYHQCRWNYLDQYDVYQVDHNFDLHNIPYDVIWLDIEHTQNKKYFTYDLTKFPDPLLMIHNLTRKGRKMVTIVDPHVKLEPGYWIYDQALKHDFLVKTAQNSTFQGWCWPGNSVYPDYTRKEVRDWWANQFNTDIYKGSTIDLYTWIDMNEPSVFNGPEVTLPKDVLHGPWENRDIHNLYGMMYHEAVYIGGLVRSENKRRPFVLTRAFFAGSQRYGAVWTGDNDASWGHLKSTLPMLLSLSISGIHFCGADVAGFFRNPEPELVLRWYQAASMQPFFRAHSHIDTARREPYLYTPDVVASIRAQIQRRYRYLPYIYTLFYESSTMAKPPLRPIWYEFPSDTTTFPIEDSYMLGSALLIKPIVDPQVNSVRLYFPTHKDKVSTTTEWWSTFSSVRFTGGQEATVSFISNHELPMFQKSGTIIPTWNRLRRSSEAMQRDPITLNIILDSNGNAFGSMYLDDFITNQHQTGVYSHVEFIFTHASLTANVTHRHYESPIWLERVILQGDHIPYRTATISFSHGKPMPLAVIHKTPSQIIIRRPGVRLIHGFVLNLYK